jgi:hypothetical protein
MHEAVQAAQSPDGLVSRSQVQVVGVPQ